MSTTLSSENTQTREKELVNQVCGVFMRFGIKAVNMDDIARHIGVSKKTLYKYFRDKRDLVIRSMNLLIDQTEEMMGGLKNHPGNAIDAELAMMRYVRKMLVEQHPSVLFDLQKYYAVPWAEVTRRREQVILTSSQENLERGQMEGVYRKDFDARIVARFMVAIADTSKNSQATLELGKPLSDIYFETFQYHIRGIASPMGLGYLEEKLAAEFPSA
jgi:AcrR family transcriptional regulator